MINIINPPCMISAINGCFYVGDEEGEIALINCNGLKLQKFKVFDEPINGIEEFQQGGRVFAYGPKIAVLQF